MLASHLEGGFSSPVLDAQAVFRALMDAMARPGTVQRLATSARPPAPLLASAGAVALALCDHDTPIWLDTALRESDAVAAWLRFHAGPSLANTPADAHFAFAAQPASLIALDNFAQGSQDYPDRSTTLVLQLETLDAGTPLILEGPGIETRTSIAPAPLPRHFAEQWRQNRMRFPRGIDVVLAAPGAIACLPRTTRVQNKEA